MRASESALSLAPRAHAKGFVWALIALVMIIATALILLAMGREPICKCGEIKLWHGVVMSAENSQHLTDWYTPSHIVHGILFYAGFWLLARITGWNIPLGARLCLGLVLECGWEIVENTDAVIARYRETTIALDYFGDSVVNSVADILAMIAGFFLAAWLPVAATILFALGLELFVGFMIRDNLTLNVIMLVWPLDWVKAWQSGA